MICPRRSAIATLAGLSVSACAVAPVVVAIGAGVGYDNQEELATFHRWGRRKFGLSNDGEVELSRIKEVVDAEVDGIAEDFRSLGTALPEEEVSELKVEATESYVRLFESRGIKVIE